jgi:hypothetical protein
MIKVLTNSTTTVVDLDQPNVVKIDAPPAGGITRAEIASYDLTGRSRVLTSDGASWVPGTSSGPMAIKDKAGNWWQIDVTLPVDVTWFDATGKNIVDDTSAFNTALSKATIIRVPEGTYKITSTLSVPSGTILFGYGANSILSASSVSGAVISATSGSGPTTISGLTLSGTATTGLIVNGAVGMLIDNINLRGLTATDGFSFTSTWRSTLSNLSTDGATISGNCFYCSTDFNANDCRNWYTSNYCNNNILIENNGHGSVWSQITAQGGNKGLWVRQYRGAIFNSLYTENVIEPIHLGDYSGGKLALGVIIDGGSILGPASPTTSVLAAINLDYVCGCEINGLSLDCMFGAADAAPITISGTGSGAVVIGRVKPTGQLHSCQILLGGSGYTGTPTGSVGGSGSSATVNVTQSGGAINSVTVGTAGTGYFASMPVAVLIGYCNRVSINDCYINDDLGGLHTPLYPWIVRSSVSVDNAGVTLNNDVLAGTDSTCLTMHKTAGSAWIHALSHWASDGTFSSTTYIPPQYP